MLREVEPVNIGAFRAPGSVDRVIAVPQADLAADEPISAETIEQEITRLTWAVLDGSAALPDRQRLAELVRHQHGMRRRLNA